MAPELRCVRQDGWCAGTRLTAVPHMACTLQVRELLLRKKEKLLDQLKALAATIPTNLMSTTGSKFSELERQLKVKAGSIEDVDAQRK